MPEPHRPNGDQFGKYVPPQVSPNEHRGLHKILIYLAGFFFIWLVVEGFLLVPILFPRYGLH